MRGASSLVIIGDMHMCVQTQSLRSMHFTKYNVHTQEMVVDVYRMKKKKGAKGTGGGGDGNPMERFSGAFVEGVAVWVVVRKDGSAHWGVCAC